MNALRPRVIAAVMRKDFQSLWPLAFGALLLPLCLGTATWVDMAPSARQLFAMLGGLATVVLFLVVLQQDGVTSPRHDWLTRPIGRWNLYLAKAAFLCLAVALPMMIAFISDQLARDRALDEAVIVSLSMLTSTLFIVIPVVLLALVTGSLVEAGVTAFAAIVVGLIVTNAFRIDDDLNGARWIASLIGNALGLFICLIAAWLLLARKNVGAARLAVLVAVTMTFLIPRYFPANTAMALQQIRGQTPESRAVTTSLAGLCGRGGDRGSVLQTTLLSDNVPAGWRLEVDHVSAHYMNADGKVVKTARGSADGGLEEGRWTLAADRLPADPVGTMRWTYALTLLAPKLSRDLVADGERRFVPGLGFCEASGGSDNVSVECFKPFAQPAAMTIHVKDRPQTHCRQCGMVDYTPGVLEGFGAKRRAVRWLEDAPPLPRNPVVTVTTYEPRAHFSRSTVTAAPRAELAAACPRKGLDSAPVTLSVPPGT